MQNTLVERNSSLGGYWARRMAKDGLGRRLKRYAVLYFVLIVPLAFFAVFRYYPIIMQLSLSFRQFSINDGVWGSPFVGMDNFRILIDSHEFNRILINTIRIAVLRVVFGFFPPIILSIMLFDMSSKLFRRVSQSILYIPFFFSWVIVYSIFFALFANTGLINGIINALGGSTVNFLLDERFFLPILIGSAIWRDLGWNTIIYLAALSGINTELFEVAKIDGAGPLQRIWYVTIPGILPVIVFLLILSLGRILSNTGVEQILLFYSPANYSVSDVIGTWVFRHGLGRLQYGLGAAVGLFEATVGLVLVLICNKIANKTAKVGIW